MTNLSSSAILVCYGCFVVVAFLTPVNSFESALSNAERLQAAFSRTFDDDNGCPMRRRRRDAETLVENYRKYCLDPVLSCDASTYRSFDGTCNNRRSKRWGAAFTCYKRMLPAHYIDNRSEPAVGPNPGEFGLKLQTLSGNTTSAKLTHLFFSFGQLLAHDIVATIGEKVKGGCCSQKSLAECKMTVDVSSDPFYVNRNSTCINFIRSAPCPCQLGGAREHMNSVTAYVDLSLLYGSSKAELDRLRDQRLPHLMYMSEKNRLPLKEEHGCKSEQCFVTGDFRANAIPMLTALHTVWARYHNYIARNLKHVNKEWKPTKVFFEARRIAIAQFQLVVYGEYLPLLIGAEAMQRQGINHIATEYNKNIEAGIYTDFATAAFRLHAQMPDDVNGISLVFFNTDYFFNKTYKDFTGEVSKAMATSAGRMFQFPMSETSFHHMYDQNGAGLNMIALNTQRGRDHGLAPYVAYAKLATGVDIAAFDDLVTNGLMTRENVMLLKGIYKDVAQIDLYIGGSLETPVVGSELGRTFGYLTAVQFKELSEGDRFFGKNAGFTADQWKELVKRTSLGRILCLATGRPFQKYPFLIDPKLEDCTKVQINFKLWT